MPVPLSRHLAERGVRDVDDAEQVDAHHAPPLIDGGVAELTGEADAGVVEADIQPRFGGDHLGDGALDVGGIGDIEPALAGAAAGGTALAGHGVCGGGIDVGDADDGAAARRLEGELATNAGTGTGNEDNLVREH